MIWSLNNDASGDKSLLAAIDAELKDGGSRGYPDRTSCRRKMTYEIPKQITVRPSNSVR